MGTARMKKGKGRGEESKKRGLSKERSIKREQKKSANGLSLPKQNTQNT